LAAFRRVSRKMALSKDGTSPLSYRWARGDIVGCQNWPPISSNDRSTYSWALVETSQLALQGSYFTFRSSLEWVAILLRQHGREPQRPGGNVTG